MSCRGENKHSIKWILFVFSDTVYTERYMGFANSNDNYRGYDVSIHAYSYFMIILKLIFQVGGAHVDQRNRLTKY